MKYLFGLIISLHCLAADIPVITIADSINPGTADYIESSIDSAKTQNVPYLVIQLDTPGGLLSATRKIIQKMLNTDLPIVVFVTPKGASATSAGALITLAADVAAMAPGTHIGAAHPVVPGSQEVGETMNKKITNDTAAFATSIAKARGRNTEWAADSVEKSASLIEKEALEKNVIDLIANDLPDLLEKLKGFKLRKAKGSITQLPEETTTPRLQEMTLRQKIVSFFSNPEIAYMIMSLGGLCIWVEVSHPGLIFPGVLGVICVLLSLIAFQMLPISYGALGFIFFGMALMIAEVFVSSYGMLGLAGAAAFIFGSLFLMDTSVPEFQIPLTTILPTAGVLVGALFLLAYAVLKSRRQKVQSGFDSLIGEYAEVREPITENTPGHVFLHGELWQAISETSIDAGSVVKVKGVRNMQLVVEPSRQIKGE